MFTLSLVVLFIVSFLLIIAVLMQASKGGGLAGVMAGGQVGTMFGVRRTADFLSNATAILAGAFIVLCILINLLFLPSQISTTESAIQGNTPSVPVQQR